MKIVWIGILALMLAATGCGNSKDHAENNSVNKGNQGNQAVENGNGANQSGDQTNEKDDAAIVAEFDERVNNNSPVSELIAFLHRHHGDVSTKNLSAMLVKLEAKQREQGMALEERYYTEEGVQEKLFDLYVANQTVPKASEVKDEAVRKLLEETEAGGFKLETAEGAFFPVIDYEQYKTFRQLVTPDMQVYIDIMAVESNVASVKDAGLVISWDEVIKRARSMEKFLEDYPDSVKREDVNTLYSGYQYITFQGIDNSPLFGYEGDEMLPEVKTAFANAVKRGPSDSKYLALMSEFLRLLEKNGFKQTDEVRAYQEKVTEGLLDDYDYENVEQNS